MRQDTQNLGLAARSWADDTAPPTIRPPACRYPPDPRDVSGGWLTGLWLTLRDLLSR